MLSFGTRGRAVGAVVVIAVVGLILAACSAASAPAGGQTRDGTGFDALGGATAGPAPDPGVDQAAGEGGGDPNAYYAADRPDLLVIKTGTMTIQVGGIDGAITAATQAIDLLGGYVSASQRSGEDADAYASITYRVPANRWDEALAAVRGVGLKVLDEQSGTEDVTGQVVDLAARIKNLQATETAFQQIMTRATEIKDVLAVQAQLTQVRGEIEQLTAQKVRLEEQAAMSTLTVTFSLKPDPVLHSQVQFDPGTEVDQATASLVRILQAIATAGIWFGIVWLPILVFAGVIALVAYAIVRRIRRAAPPALTADGGSV
jgi:Domain of unknown function (DUF4349)